MKTISYWIRGYFGFSQKEASGFIILSSLIIMTILAPLIYDKIVPSENDTSLSDQRILNSLIAEIETGKELQQNASMKPSNITRQEGNYFPFDPNSATAADFQKLGIKTHMAERIVKYRNKGGKFKIKKDLQKIYGFPVILFEKLQTYITLPDSIQRTEKKQHVKEASLFLIDINKADTVQLNKLRGIGNVMSARIIKYRDKLGGFVSKDQYKDVYSIPDPALEDLRKKTFIEKGFIPSKLNINTASLDILSAHPYIGRKIAYTIVNYREHHEKFGTADDLKQIITVSPEQVEKLKPYLDF
ncbi:MAG TPA: helix-hairpin-helix domain-containing protein [Cytophagaceae bacterium]|jgi:competence protein ComEA|nr:helix-hairpin-helix domain-containing protein [Cytophagaceae bacterium]